MSNPVDPIKSDLRNFIFLLWKHLGLPEPTPIQYSICLYLQHGPKRRIIEAFRGVGKSWLTAGFVLWRLYRDPNERVLIISASKVRADSFSIFLKRIINEWEVLHHLKPRQDQRDSNIAFDVGPAQAHQAPSVRSVGVTGQMTGGRATLIIPDDVEVPSNSMTQAQRDKLAQSVKEFDAVLTPEGEIVYLGTPQCEMSLYNVLPSRGYELRIWPARFPNGDQYNDLYQSRLSPFIKKQMEENPELALGCHGRGNPTEPSRFHDLDLIEREQSYGRAGFTMQFMLNTSLSDQDRYPLKLSDFMVMDLNPTIGPVSLAWGSSATEIINDLPSVGLEGDRWHRPIFVSQDFISYQGVVMTIDPAGRGGDELGYAVVAFLNGTLFLLACGGLRGGYSDDNLIALANTAKQFKVNLIKLEDNFGDGMFTKLLTPVISRIYPVTLEDIKSSKQKELRIIDTIEPVLQQHRMVVDKALVVRDQENYNRYPEDSFNQYQLFYQLTRITRERGALAKDDRVDALAMAVAHWMEEMDRDTQKAEAEHKAALLDQELRDFENHVFGRPPQALNWAVR
jgi:hypothetical protein